MSLLRKIFANINRNELGFDAWGRNKVINDRSIIHGMFTYNVPVSTWREIIDKVEQPSFVNATSINGKLSLKSTAVLDQEVALETFRNPRYRPNRGHLYSTSVFFPNPTANGIRDIGFFNYQGGFFFRLKSDGIYACTQTTLNGVIQPVDENKITDLPTGIDFSKGNIYDIQMQWRGVGDVKFFINLELVYTMKNLNQLTELSSFNPAIPICFRNINKGDIVETQSGCVDISTEGGNISSGTYGSIGMENDNGQVAISGLNVPILAIRSKTLIGAILNTRDTLALLATAYADQRCIFRVWATRDFTAITENQQSWKDFSDGHLEYIPYNIPPVGSPMSFDSTKADLIFGARVDQDQSYSTSALFEGRTDIYLTPGDMFIFTIHRENGNNATVGATFEFAEEI